MTHLARTMLASVGAPPLPSVSLFLYVSCQKPLFTADFGYGYEFNCALFFVQYLPLRRKISFVLDVMFHQTLIPF